MLPGLWGWFRCRPRCRRRPYTRDEAWATLCVCARPVRVGPVASVGLVPARVLGGMARGIGGVFGPMGGCLGPWLRRLTPWVAVWAGLPMLHL